MNKIKELDQQQTVDRVLEWDDQLVNEVILRHYQQYQDVCIVMVELNYDHVYLNQILEQEMLQGIDDHEV
jgi:hypothetical protein